MIESERLKDTVAGLVLPPEGSVLSFLGARGARED